MLLVVWANFICSLLYLAAAYGLVKLKKWPYKILIVAVAVLSIAFAGLLIHISRGGLHETKTRCLNLGSIFVASNVSIINKFNHLTFILNLYL